MRQARIAVFALVIGCAAAEAQSPPECTADSECVAFTECCSSCCPCPIVLSQREATRHRMRCERVHCGHQDCADIQCDVCAPVHPACVRGHCRSR